VAFAAAESEDARIVADKSDSLARVCRATAKVTGLDSEAIGQSSFG
jgi:hypothetical protein